MKRKILKCVILCCLVCLIAGCKAQPQPTETTTLPPMTTQAPTTEPTTVPTTEAPALPLEMAQPLESEIVTLEETLVFAGVADPRYCVEINGQQIQPDESGAFPS